MTALLGILAYIVAVAGLGAVYWVLQKRAGEEEPRSVPPPQRTPAAPVLPEREASTPPQVPDPVTPPLESTTLVQESDRIQEPASTQEPVNIQEPDTSASPVPSPGLLQPEIEPEVEAPPIAPPPQPMPPAIPVADGGKATPEEVPALPLEQAIATWGELGQAFRIPELARFATHADSNVRTAVAVALGKIALKQRGAGVERMVPVLGKLSRDVNQQVRLEAITALSQIRSASVLPWLQQALRSPDGETNKAASLALQRSRLSQTPKPAKPARVPLQRRK